VSEKRLATAVDTLLDELVGSGAEVGLQVAVVRNGRTVVDAARGVADPRTAAPVDPGTLFWAGSTAKGVAASLAHVLIERADLTDDMRIVEVWPGSARARVAARPGDAAGRGPRRRHRLRSRRRGDA
jgi:CubicO group peptidase (beta-lactamase class C family)